LELIHENIEVQTIRDDLDTLIMDANILEKISEKEAKTKAREVEMKIMKAYSSAGVLPLPFPP
jgi:type I restriction enzyme R subunit